MKNTNYYIKYLYKVNIFITLYYPKNILNDDVILNMSKLINNEFHYKRKNQKKKTIKL